MLALGSSRVWLELLEGFSLVGFDALVVILVDRDDETVVVHSSCFISRLVNFLYC